MILFSFPSWKNNNQSHSSFKCHCEYVQWEILLRNEAKDLDCEFGAVISNHSDLKYIADAFGIPFKVFPIGSENKAIQEEKEIALLKNELKVDIIVLARYMQVLSNEFLQSFQLDQIINIHHSFLPAFMGGKPYQKAYERGVKLIGATVSTTCKYP